MTKGRWEAVEFDAWKWQVHLDGWPVWRAMRANAERGTVDVLPIRSGPISWDAVITGSGILRLTGVVEIRLKPGLAPPATVEFACSEAYVINQPAETPAWAA